MKDKSGTLVSTVVVGVSISGMGSCAPSASKNMPSPSREQFTLGEFCVGNGDSSLGRVV